MAGRAGALTGAGGRGCGISAREPRAAPVTCAGRAWSPCFGERAVSPSFHLGDAANVFSLHRGAALSGDAPCPVSPALAVA